MPTKPLDYYVVRVEHVDQEARDTQANAKALAAKKDELILAAIEDGHRAADVARALGVGDARISQIRKRAKERTP